MRSTAGIVAGLFFVGIVANCGGNDASSPGATGAAAGEGGEPTTTTTGATSTGGTSNAGQPNTAMGGEGGMPAATGCTKDADCGASAKCVDTVCKKNDGQACASAADCQNNCIDSLCTSGLADGKDCTVDEDCAHTCIDNICATPSDVGGDCDVDLGAGGGGGAGAGGASGVSGAAGDGGAAAVVAQARDCAAPLQCYGGKCLTPDGEACKDNVDCVNTCVNSVCEPRATLDGACDDKSDCDSDAFVCEAATGKCKLDLKQQCSDNPQCESKRCICSDTTCLTRTCKTADSVCQCKWSPQDSASCDTNSAPLSPRTQDPNGCAASSANICNQGQCVPNTAGDCKQQCKYLSAGDDMKANTADDICGEFGAPTGCSAGYHGAETPNGACAPYKTPVYDQTGTVTGYNYPCQAQCTCELN